MITNLKTFKAIAMLSMILFSFFTISTINPNMKVIDNVDAKVIEFNSYIDFEYDATVLSKPLEIDVSVSMPLKVQFWTDIPPLFGNIPFPFNNLILFGQSVGPMQKIHLEVVNPPDWANIFISSPDVLLDIPFSSKDNVENINTRETTLIVSPKIEAPAESQKITIKATCDLIGRLKGTSYQEVIQFTPSFIPTVQINVEDPVRTVGPHESINFNVKVKNVGNKITRITPNLVDKPDDWNPTINPPQVEVAPDSQSTFTFSVVTPFDFGWHNEFESFEIKFRSEVYPYRTAAANNTQSIYLTVNNLGFSMPGFELVSLMVAIFGLTYIMKKRNKKNEN